MGEYSNRSLRHFVPRDDKKNRRVKLDFPALANSELAVMKLLWEQDLVTARGIRERLYPDSTKAQHGTVQKLLQRLEDKGFVVRNKEQSVHRFSASVGSEDYACGQLETLADKLTEGSITPLITHFVEGKKISQDDIKKLRAILDNHIEDGEN